jgi:hypothetical protein
MDEPFLNETLIAPCGMNCGVCRAYLRPKKRCSGCNAGGEDLPTYCAACRMRLCTKRTGRFCHDCAGFPCARLKRLDRRYRARYGMSEVENLECIRDHGIERFLENERERWVSEEGVLCVHDKNYYRRTDNAETC